MVPRGVIRGPISFRVRGIERRLSTDIYYVLLAASWRYLFLAIVAVYLLLNALFAVVYLIFGGIEGARPGNFGDAFYFSVQTMATIGYGVMHPTSQLANVLVTLEALIGLLGVAMATGVLFAKFARPEAKVVFSDVAVIAPREGVRSLMFRIANHRTNHVVEAGLSLYVVRNEVTSEGERVRRWHELKLERARSPVFALTWTAIHRIDEDSPIFGKTTELLRESGSEVVVIFVGLDATLAATIHARHSYVAEEIVFGARLADILVQDEDGTRALDLARFHDTLPQPLDPE